MSVLITGVQPPGEADVPAPVWQEYPKVMIHPHAVKASSAIAHGEAQIQPGDRFPPVTVMNSDQEAWHRAQGYGEGGANDASAFANATPGPVSVHVHVEYPKWVGDVLCQNAAEEAALTPKAKAEPKPKVEHANAKPKAKPRRKVV